jgi:nitroreductase
MKDVLDLMQERYSARVPYDPNRPVTKQQLEQVTEAASWAPTAHNMQNFEIVVVDDPAILQAIGTIKTKISAVFLRENFQQLSFSKEELRRKKTGVIASMFPPSWRTPNSDFDAVVAAAEPVPLSVSLQDSPCLLLVLYDARKRAPASERDVLGFISLGCIMENMWLMAQSLGIGLQILSVFSSESVEREMRRILDIPSYLKVAYGCRLGYPAATLDYVRVRRTSDEFVHRNGYGNKGLG